MLFDEEQFVKRCRFCQEVTDNFRSLIKHEASHYTPEEPQPITVTDQVDGPSTPGDDVPNNVLNNQNQISNSGGQDQDVKVKIENHSQDRDEPMKVDENNQLNLDDSDDDGSIELEFDDELQEEFKEYLDYCLSQNKSSDLRRGRGRGRIKGRGKGKQRLMKNKKFRFQNINFTQNQTRPEFDFYEVDKEISQMIRDYKWEKDAKRVKVNGEPFLECLTCGRRIKGANKVSFFHHYQAAHTTTGHTLYACIYCNLTFSQPSSRLRHAIQRHKDKKIQKDISIHTNIPRRIRMSMPKLSRQTLYVPKYNHQIQEREDEILLNERIRNYTNWENDAKRITVDGKLVFECLICSKNIGSKVSLFNHMMTHTGELPLSCFYCSLKFRRADNRRLHEMRQHPNKGTTNEQFHNSENTLELNLPKLEFKESIPDIGSSNQKQKQKPISTRPTSSKKLIKPKFTSEKPNEEQIKLYNKICRENTREDEKILKKRIKCYNWECDGAKINIQGQVLEYQCLKCPQILKSKSGLFFHTQTHTMIKSLKCFFCPSQFGRTDQRRLHEMKHLHINITGSKPLKNSIKKHQNQKYKVTTTSSKLKNKASNLPEKKLAIKKEKSESKPKPSNGHKAIDSSRRRDDENILYERIRAYDWSLDGKMVDTTDNVKEGKSQKHQAFQCLNCDSILSSKAGLFNHSFKHNNLERPLKCSLCSNTFIQPVLRKAHEFRSHGIGTDPVPNKRKSDRSDRKSINLTDQMDNELDEVSNRLIPVPIPIVEEPLNLSNSTDQIDNELDQASNQSVVEEPLNLSVKEPQSQNTVNDDNSKGKTDFKVDAKPVKSSKSKGTKTVTKTKREDELIYLETFNKYNWENDGKKLKVEKDGKIIELYECFKCQTQIKSKRGFFDHNLIHSQLKIFKCQFCGKSFRQIATRNVHEKTHTAKSEKLTKINVKLTQVGNVKKLTKKHTNVKRPAKIEIQKSIDIYNLNDIIHDINNAVKDENINSSEVQFEEKLSNGNDNDLMIESGNASTDILSQFSDFVLESENRKELSCVEDNIIGDIDMMDMDDYANESKSGENVLMNDTFVQPTQTQPEPEPIKECIEEPIQNCDSDSDEEMTGQRKDELKYSEDLANYNWEKDGKRINCSITCLQKKCKKKYKTKRDFYNHMLAVHWMIFQFKCKYCEKYYGQSSTRKTHEASHTMAEKKLVSKANRLKKRKVSVSQNDQVNVKIEENSLSLNNPGTCLIDESNVVNTMISEDQSLNREKVSNNGDKDANDQYNDCKKKNRKSEVKKSTKSKQKYNLKNVEKCYNVYFTDEQSKESKIHQCKKCCEILRGASTTELLNHAQSHSQ